MNIINLEIWCFPKPPNTVHTKDYLCDMISRLITDGVLKRGERLPPYRAVAECNGIGKTTMHQVYKMLEEDGWLVSVHGSGTFVAPKFPGEISACPPYMTIERLPVSLEYTSVEKIKDGPHFHDFLTIGPDTPSSHYVKCWDDLSNLTRYDKVFDINSQLSRVASMDNPQFKPAIFKYLELTRNFRTQASNREVIVGRRESLDQIFGLLLKPGDVMVNSSPKDRKLCRVLKAQQGVDNQVIVFDDDFLQNLKDKLSNTTIKALYIRPQCSYPESLTLNTQHAAELVELAKQYSFYIIEEDDYHEFWKPNKPFKPLINYDHNGHVIYIGALSMSLTYFQQIRIIIASAQFIILMQCNPISHSAFKETIPQALIIELMESGKLWKSVKRMKREHANHMFAAGMQLDNAFNELVKVTKPLCGLSIWLTFPDDKTLTKAMSAIEARGIKIPYIPGTQMPGNGVRHIRVGIGNWNAAEAIAPIKVLSEIFNKNF